MVATPNCLRCDPVLHTGYPPPWVWPPGWGGGIKPPTIDPNALAIKCPVTPNTAVAGAADLAVTIPGQNLTATCVAYLGTTALATVGTPTPTSMVATVPAASMATAGNHQITVKDGAATAIGSCPFTVTAAPILSVICPLQPASVLVSTTTTVTVKGTLFTAASIVMLDGVDQATTFVDDTTLTFSFVAGAVAATNTISVKDGANTAATTCPLQTTLTPLLTVTCPVAPATAVAGSTTPLTVTVTGTNFTATTVATVDGIDQTTTFGSATSISFGLTVPATVPSVQTLQIGARDGANTAAATCPFTITPVAVIKPTPTYVWPDLIGQDDPVKTVTVTGTNFDATTQVILTQTPMVTTYVSPTQVTFVTQSPMWTNGTMTLRVRNGGTVQGEGTATLPFGVWNNPHGITLLPVSAPANTGIVTVQMGVNDTPGTPLAQVTVDDVPVATTGSGTLSFQIDTTGAPGTIRKCSVRVGHDHPEGHDNITPQPMEYADFTIT
jgi:hypothetical protein